ncbi:hypothetical protein V5O48_001059 [Marasmius crinis-equi]|uniref:Uncharacterized protein n=1 Tax=Marasmius crinis-equi TaxID=585013 RepID=A0ABR3FZU2_9AGAR
MKSAIAFVLVSAASVMAQVTMNTPTNLVACQPVQLTWSGGKAPYFISVQDGNNPTGTALERFDNQSGTSLSWTVNFAGGTSVGFLLRDSDGATSQTAATTIQAGSSTDCIGKSATVSGGGTNTGGTGSPTQTSAGGSTTNGATTTSSGSGGSSTSSSGSSTTSADSANNSNAASAASAQVGVAGLVGAAVLALLA